MTFLNKLFRKKKGLSKLEFWKKFELYDLIKDLNTAKSIIDNDSESTNSELYSFVSDFDEELYNVSFDNVPDFTQIWKWFKPNGLWQKYYQNEELRAKIYARSDKWKRNHAFVSGTKVKLDNEIGVVIVDNGKEVIRWDTNKRIDEEDWTGLFGTFLENGGLIINQDQPFKYIDNNGKFKNSVK